MSTIFVQIASYQDHELEPTILDCIEKLSGDHEIHFGVALCYCEDTISVPDVPNLKIIKSQAPNNLGVGIARFLANSLYDNEDYYLQVDSHTRFIENWDREIVNCYEYYKENGLNPVITTYPARYWYEDNILKLDENMSVTYIDFKHDDNELFKSKKFLHQTAKPNQLDNLFTKSVSGGSIFSSGKISSIEPNKVMFNWGEEMIYAIRLFTHGYDLVLPQKQYLYHLYYDHENVEGNKRNLSGKDFPELSQEIYDNSFNEVKRIIEGNVVGDQELGTERTLEDYAYYAQIEFKSI
jgi:hypothetical protein